VPPHRLVAPEEKKKKKKKKKDKGLEVYNLSFFREKNCDFQEGLV
jgi:hypothetical protein